MQPINYSRFQYHSITRSATPVHRFHINNVRQAAAHADRRFYHQQHEVFPAHPTISPFTTKAMQYKDDPFLKPVFDKAKIIAQKWYVLKLAINTCNNNRATAIAKLKEILGFDVAIPDHVHVRSIAAHLGERLTRLNEATSETDILHWGNFTLPLNIFEPMQRIRDVMADFERTTPPRNDIERSRNVCINDGIALFTRIFENWDLFFKICHSQESDTVKQSLMMSELGVPLHDSFAIACNNADVIRTGLTHVTNVAPEQIKPAWIIGRFDSNQPCLNARCRRYFNPDEPIIVETKVKPTESISINLLVYSTAFAEAFPDLRTDAHAFYRWIIDQDGFMGARVLDGMIETRDVLEFIADQSVYLHEFDTNSINDVLATYGAGLNIQITE